MSTYYSYGKRRRRFNFKMAFAIVALVGAIGTTGLMVRMHLAENRIQEYTKNITDLQKQTEKLEGEVPPLTEAVQALEKEVGYLQEVINHMQPVVVPNSMK